jgi:hypothetical protein
VICHEGPENSHGRRWEALETNPTVLKLVGAGLDRGKWRGDTGQCMAYPALAAQMGFLHRPLSSTGFVSASPKCLSSKGISWICLLQVSNQDLFSFRVINPQKPISRLQHLHLSKQRKMLMIIFLLTASNAKSKVT